MVSLRVEVLRQARDSVTFTSRLAFALSTRSAAWQALPALVSSRHLSLLVSLTNHLDRRDQNLARALSSVTSSTYANPTRKPP
jgi:hypothetical protein